MAPNPQPRQVWYARVPFDEGYDAKDRPCLVVDRHGDSVTVLKITSRNSSDRAGYIPLPTRSWNPRAAADSWLRLDPPVRLAISDGVFRRRLGRCDDATWRAASRGRHREWVSTGSYRGEPVPTGGRAALGAGFAGTVAALSAVCGLYGLFTPGSRSAGVVWLVAAVMAGLVYLKRVRSGRDTAIGKRWPAAPSRPRDSSPAGEEGHGTVAWFDPVRGYGFIDTDGGDRAFVHRSAIRRLGQRTLDEGRRVSFRPVPSDRGPRVEDVYPLD